MRCAPVIVLRASSSVRQGTRQLEHIPPNIEVVLVREHRGEVRYYVFGGEALRARLSTADPAADLASELDLASRRPAIPAQLDYAMLAGTVALEGNEVVGVLVDDDAGQDTGLGDWGPDFKVGGSPPFRPGHTFDLPRGVGVVGEGGGQSTGIDIQTPRPTTAPSAPSDPPMKLDLFSAYSDVEAPGQVGANDTFAVTVGFSREPAPAMLIEGLPITVRSGPKPEFTIQISGFGFKFPDGIRRKLVIDRDNPASKRAQFTVIPDPAENAAPRRLDVSYEFAGAVVGRAWAQILVKPATPLAPATRAVTGGTGVVSVTSERTTAPHLGVDITSKDGASDLSWRFHTRYGDVALPSEDVATSLGEDSARSFAVALMRDLPTVTPGKSGPMKMRGNGKMIADALPKEFWPIFAAVWQRARAAGEIPRMQITITEAWIPWELAWIGKDRFDGAADLLGPDCQDGAALGQLWQVARWTPPTTFLRTGDLPAAPPAMTMDANEMAVIVGNYTGDRGTPVALPDAVKEGGTIACTYDALELSASDSDVTALLEGTLERNGKNFEPTVVHFAGHGQTDVDNPEFSGLLLEDGSRLDRATIRGSNLVNDTRPFVFLNACEAGVAGETLMNLGGLVGAFLGEGARGFIGPLWKVNDAVARNVAEEFYRRTLQGRETVSEVMRQIRRKFSSDSPAASELAYVFYGNPDLRLERGPA